MDNNPAANKLWAAQGNHSVLDRAAYESLCAELGIPVLSDDECKRLSYALEFGQFSTAEQGVEYCAKMAAASRYWRHVAESRKAQERARLEELAAGSAESTSRWGAHGVRYDEACAACGRVTQIDNDTEMCRQCGGAK